MRCSSQARPSKTPATIIMEERVLSTEQFIPTLALMTLGIVAVYAIVNFFRTKQRQGDRQQTPLTRTSENKRARDGSIVRK